ncbi:F-box domain protein [Kalmanozyma brasiliensis GHG001]|uniref:F-box domain protein n=1 Tax=Kalmanozyma brasiliensis (strain GHG001) TaxID=1365824 RepID=UPI001CEA1027|nr:F-box domain protein [Kalmanozyma brasiliensis GHG001]KAF6767609.1 F-box domain protein [Kalmanozyma brasiliensis GHG001]
MWVARHDPHLHLKRGRDEQTNSLPKVKMPDSKKPSDDGQLSDTLEARLSAAEQDVVAARRIGDDDELIAVASTALQEKPRAPSKTTIKSRKNLLWARSEAYRRQKSHTLALKDAKAVLKIDPDDVAAYIQTAAVLKDAGHTEQARACLEKAAASAEKYDRPTRNTWLRRLQKQARKILGGSLMNRLPNEILIEVALHLDTNSRVAMSQTCRPWRHLLVMSPGLWTSLVVKAKPTTTTVTEGMAIKWLNYINAGAEKARHRLEHVELFVQFPRDFLGKALTILRLSSETLTHIDIETWGLGQCYELEDQVILQALQELRNLEVLDLAAASLSTFIFLLPRRTVVDSEPAVRFPLPKLQEITLYARQLDLRALAHTLLIRDYVQAGDGLATARRKAAKTLETLRAGAAKASKIIPFERGSSRSQRNGPQEFLRQEDDPPLKDASKCCRLRTLRLTHMVGIEDDVKEAMRLVVADLQIEYIPL